MVSFSPASNTYVSVFFVCVKYTEHQILMLVHAWYTAIFRLNDVSRFYFAVDVGNIITPNSRGDETTAFFLFPSSLRDELSRRRGRGGRPFCILCFLFCCGYDVWCASLSMLYRIVLGVKVNDFRPTYRFPFWKFLITKSCPPWNGPHFIVFSTYLCSLRKYITWL